MNLIWAIVAWLFGCGVGLSVLARYPQGIERTPALALFALAGVALLPSRVAPVQKQVRWACILMSVALAGCGWALLQHKPATPTDLAYYNSNGQKGDAPAVVIGTVLGEPVFGDKWQRVHVRADHIASEGNDLPAPVAGDMSVTVARFPEFVTGERAVFTGTLTVPPTLQGFDYAAYLARLGIYSAMNYPRVHKLSANTDTSLGSFVLSSRKQVRQALQREVSEPESSLAVGVVTGDRSYMSPDVTQAFQQSGTAHVLAISGENISLLVGAVWLLFGGRRNRRRMPLWLLIVMLGSLLFYTLFTGVTASVVRAALMSVVLLLGPWVGRRYDPVAALAVAAAAMTLWEPQVLGDVGFQLSFAAMLGLALVSPHIEAVAARLRLPRALSAPVSAGLGAQAATVPLILLLTGRVSIVSPFATLTADIALLPLMITGITAGALGALAPLPWLASLLGLSVWPCAAWMLWWVQAWAALPWASVQVGNVNPGWVALYYVLLGSILALNKTGAPPRWHGLPLRPLAFSALALWVALVGVLFVK